MDLWVYQDHLFGTAWSDKPLVSIVLYSDPNNVRYLQRSNEVLLSSVADRTGCQPVAGGLVGCGKRADRPNFLVYASAIEHYSTPDPMKPLVIVCGFSVLEHECEVEYGLSDGIAVSYHFYRQPIGKKPAVPIGQAIELDRAVRTSIHKWLMPEYPWFS